VKEGRGIQSKGLSTTKYKGLEMADERKEIRKVDQTFCGTLQSQRDISSNAIELELPKSIRIHPVVNVSRVQLYKPQVEGQKKILPKPVIIEREKEFEIKKILNKKTVREKEKFLVR